MSLPSESRNRTLTLTEELERLEQQITLTLQEIDGNFSKAHRIVTGSILPIVEQYAKHSGNVWEGSKFWKHFFEASANVSLSGYEEGALEDDQRTQTEDTTDQDRTLHTPRQSDQSKPGAERVDDEDDSSFTVDSPTQVTGVQSTPKLTASTGQGQNAPSSQQRTRTGKASAASFRSPSPRKYTGHNPLAIGNTPSQPSTPRPQQTQLVSSPFEPQSGYRHSAQRTREQNADAFLHRNVLDKHYRVQATPHTQRRERAQQPKPTPSTATATTKQPWDDSPPSSPEISAPQLRSDLFSPAPPKRSTATQPRTPGVSILTPARNKAVAATGPKTSTGRSIFSPEHAPQTRTSVFSNVESDSEDDDNFGMSPPKTMQFHVPQSRLLQTPAREASKRIVADLLMTAGAEDTDEIEGLKTERGVEEESPSLVRKGWDEDDTF